MGKKRYGMVIDLQKCVGCTGCDLACKSENNTPLDINWAGHIVVTKGTFPEVSYEHIPTLCNHCDSPGCVRVCPTKSMHKDEETGIVLHDPNICIGCKSCIQGCPYGVIHFNQRKPHSEWKKADALIEGCTASSRETTKKLDKVLPYQNPGPNRTYESVREKGVVEKCTFCYHLVVDGKDPHCVTTCPADARIFGDLNDSESNVSKLLRKYNSKVLKPHKGTEPKVFYIRNYNNE